MPSRAPPHRRELLQGPDGHAQMPGLSCVGVGLDEGTLLEGDWVGTGRTNMYRQDNWRVEGRGERGHRVVRAVTQRSLTHHVAARSTRQRAETERPSSRASSTAKTTSSTAPPGTASARSATLRAARANAGNLGATMKAAAAARCERIKARECSRDEALRCHSAEHCDALDALEHVPPRNIGGWFGMQAAAKLTGRHCVGGCYRASGSDMYTPATPQPLATPPAASSRWPNACAPARCALASPSRLARPPRVHRPHVRLLLSQFGCNGRAVRRGRSRPRARAIARLGRAPRQWHAANIRRRSKRPLPLLAQADAAILSWYRRGDRRGLRSWPWLQRQRAVAARRHGRRRVQRGIRRAGIANRDAIQSAAGDCVGWLRRGGRRQGGRNEFDAGGLCSNEPEARASRGRADRVRLGRRLQAVDGGEVRRGVRARAARRQRASDTAGAAPHGCCRGRGGGQCPAFGEPAAKAAKGRDPCDWGGCARSCRLLAHPARDVCACGIALAATEPHLAHIWRHGWRWSALGACVRAAVRDHSERCHCCHSARLCGLGFARLEWRRALLRTLLQLFGRFVRWRWSWRR